MKIKIKFVVVLSALALLAAGCNPFTSNKGYTGIFKTTNGGLDWVSSNKTVESKAVGPNGASISSFAFDATNSKNLYAGSYSSGVFFSEDSGEHWTQVLSKIAVYDVALAGRGKDNIFAAGIFADHGKLLKSSDGGKSWLEVYNEESTTNEVRTVAINPNANDEIIIGLASGNVIKSSDAGRTWKLLKNFESKVQRIKFSGSTLFVLTRDKGLFRSDDGGANFVSLTSSAGASSSNNFIFSSDTDISACNQFAVLPSNLAVILMGCDKGLYKTTDAGAHWSKLLVPIKDQSAPFRTVAFGNSGDAVFFASAGATVYKTLDGGSSFSTQGVNANGFVNSILVDPNLEQIAFIGVY